MMFKRTLTQPDIFLIAANLLPVAGVWFFGWNPKQVFIVYCMETIIIGFYNLVKMAIITAVRKTDIWDNNGSQTRVSGLVFIFFFLVHYGMFVAIQMGLFFGISGIADEYKIGFFSFFYKWPQLLTPGAVIMLGVFFISYGYKMFAEFIIPGLYRTTSLGLQMFQPYMRIFIQQFVVILGSFFLLFGAGKIFILIFALVKIAFEVYVNFEAVLNKAIGNAKSGSGK